ncbi:trafficking protein particle complex subunit 10 [Boletus reticuloceps]|uniref:Trafficking protein particle complex subunit 10 n=1 Tax=Boletus reticuloceps TaxID=495285 RepID=A0A8I2YQ49_9AGAM|nr:trafficking protein particle complex subunit 10 [Boletus reticuloceps]
MSSQHVLLTFAAAPQSSESCKQVIAALRSQLPLRSIHWRSASRPSIRTIQELEVTLVALDSLRDELTSQVPLTLLEKPLLNLLVVTCEDNEVYRATVKRQIKDWQTSVLPRKNQEWLIVHVVRPDTKVVDRKFFNMKSSVLDKIKADFNVDKRDRCVQLAWSAGEQSPAVWADLISKIKDGLLSALDNSVLSREEELKRSESQRHMPGWNFCTYFILKESLASSYEGINLFEDALEQYNELEAAFMQVLREKNMSWFGSLIHPTLNDDSMPLLSTSKKPYRDLILANTISVFDLRVYLLSRQSALLSKLCQPSEICWKAFTFLSTFGRRLRGIESSLPDYFIESWTFSSALSVLDQCDSWALSWPELDAQSLARYSARKGELIELAKSQLDILGVREGYLPSSPPFSLAIPTPAVVSDLPITDNKSSDCSISKREIISAIENKETFYDIYTTISNRAIDMCVKAGRRKFALKILGSLAVLDIYRGRLSNALTIFTSLPAHYAPHGWTSLESLMLSRAIDTHAVLKKPRDREWIHILLAFLKTYVTDRSTELVMSDDDIMEYIAGLVSALREAAEKLDSDLIHSDLPVISVSVDGDASPSEEEDSLSLEVIVQNRLPCDVLIDEVSVTLTGQDANRLRFAARVNKVSPGDNHLTLNCATACSGLYVLDNSETQISRLRLQWSHKTSASTVAAKGTMLSLHLEEVSFDYANAQDVSGLTTAGEFDPSESCIKIAGVPKDTNMDILVPHTDASRFSAMKIDVKVTYNTISQPTVTRTLRKSHNVTVSLPIAVNVEDFFRGKRLFSKFSISATTHQYVRLSSADLQGPSHGLKITKYRSSQALMTVSPQNPINYVFSIESEHGPVLEPLKLVIVYRILREEVVALIHAILDDILARTSHHASRGRELGASVIQYLESDTAWVELYSATGELLIPSTALEIEEGLGELFTTLQQRLAHSRPLAASPCPWREIRIPVDVPRMNIIAAARIKIHSSPLEGPEKPAPIYAGQPISGTLSIRTSLHWGDPESKLQKYILRYDIEERIKDWLVCGRKRGEFIARDDETFSVPLTLIALHHGELTLPKIEVKPLPLAGDGMTTNVFPNTDTHQTHGAETILVLPRGGRSTFVVGMGLHDE